MRLLGVLALLGCASLACSSPSSGSGGVVGGRGEGSKSAWKPHNGVVLLRQRRSGQSPPPFTGVHKVVVNLRGGAGSSAAKSSPSQTVINIAKYLIGGGMLALPAGMSAGKGTGWVPALGLLIAAMLICAKTFIMVGNTANDSGVSSAGIGLDFGAPAPRWSSHLQTSGTLIQRSMESDCRAIICVVSGRFNHGVVLWSVHNVFLLPRRSRLIASKHPPGGRAVVGQPLFRNRCCNLVFPSSVGTFARLERS
jgi:hypothetical protein